MRTPLVAGNWKMHGNRASNRSLLEAVAGGSASLQGVECAVCVPFPYLGEVAGQLKGTRLGWGAQNLSEHAQGAYTGEVSGAMLKEFGCRYVLVGIPSAASTTAIPTPSWRRSFQPPRRRG